MSEPELFVPGNSNNKEKKEIVVDYQPTEQDEEDFFLMYHMNIQPSELQKLSQKYKRWLIARFIAQKNMEREAFENARILSELQSSGAPGIFKPK